MKKLWLMFVEFAKGHGININNQKDYEAWWICFQAGAQAQLAELREYVKKLKEEPQ